MKLNFTKEGLLRADEFAHLVDSMETLDGCVFYPALAGRHIDGVTYKAVDYTVCDIDRIKDALETVASAYGLNIKFEP